MWIETETEMHPQNNISEEERLEQEIEKFLLEKGTISSIPSDWNDDDEDFEPIEVLGKPISETIIEERGER